MSRKRIVTVVILVLIFAVAAWFYFDYRSTPQVQAPGAPVGTSTTPQQTNFVEVLEKNWTAISAKIPLEALDSKRWYIDAVRTIGPSVAMVAFEDGLNGNTAIIGGSDYEIRKIYESQMQFTAAELTAIQKQYGDPAYKSQDFQPSEGDGHLVRSTLNVFLQPANTMQVKVALLNTDGTLPNEVKPGDISGCDHVVLLERTVPASNAPLRAALNLLLAKGDWSDQQIAWGKLYNYANRGTLALDSVSIVSGTAKVYLVGTPPTLGGVCDDPRLFVQVAQTARQFATVQKVELYVNGVRNDGSSNLRGE